MKVLHEFFSLEYSGAEIKLRNMAGMFEAGGIKSYALATSEGIGPFAEELRAAGCQIAHIPLSNRIKFLLQYYSYLRKENFDIVHIHLEHMSFWVALVTKLSGVKKIVRSYHSCFPYVGMVRRTNITKRWIVRNIFGVANIAVSAAVLENEQNRLNNPCLLLNNGVNENLFRPLSPAERQNLRAALGFADKDFVFVVVGSCNCRKRHDDIIMMMKNVSEKNLHNVLLLHLGIGPLSENEKKLVGELGLDENVHFLVNQSNVVQYLQISDVFLMPSDNEGLGIALLEAMACGLPVVVSDIPPFKQIVEDGKNGIICKKRDVQDLTEKCLNLMENQEKRAALGQNARMTVEKGYTLQSMFDETMNVYAQ